jgi:hypothetical protein
MDYIQYHPVEVIPTCDARAGWSRRDNAIAFCRGTRGLRSFLDFQGFRRYYCASPGHRGSAIRLYGIGPMELTETDKRGQWGDR